MKMQGRFKQWMGEKWACFLFILCDEQNFNRFINFGERSESTEKGSLGVSQVTQLSVWSRGSLSKGMRWPKYETGVSTVKQRSRTLPDWENTTSECLVQKRKNGKSQWACSEYGGDPGPRKLCSSWKVLLLILGYVEVPEGQWSGLGEDCWLSLHVADEEGRARGCATLWLYKVT